MKTEEEILKLAQIFDDIIGSESRAVQEAFQRLTLLATMAKPDNEHFEQGPFARMITGIQVMEQEIRSLRRSVQILENTHSSTNNIDSGHSGLTIGDSIDLSGIQTITLHGATGSGGVYTTADYVHTMGTPHVSPLAPLTSIDIVTLTNEINDKF